VASASPPLDPPGQAGGGGSSPVLALLARGLELWLRGQCQAIEALEIELLGSGRQLLGGELSGVRLRARRVRYRDLAIERVELVSEPIRVRMGQLLRGAGQLLDQPFAISGSVVFSGEGLRLSFGHDPWRTLGDALAEEAIGVAPLVGLRLDGDQLVLQALPVGAEQPLEVSTLLQVSDDGLNLHRGDGSLAARLPMDPNIHIERAEIASGLLELQGQATVLP